MKYLVVGPSWVGDMVMAQVLFQLLKQQPDAEIDVMAPAWSKPLLERMPEVSRSIHLPFKHGELALSKRVREAKKLIAQQYEQVFVLPNSLKSALIPFWAKIPKRTGWRGEFRYGLLNDIRPLDKSRYPLMTERFAALFYPRDARLPSILPIPELLADAENQRQVMSEPGLDLERPVLAICPGAEFGPAKQWPARHHVDVINYFVARGWQVWIFGSRADMPVSQAIEQGVSSPLRKHVYNLAGRTALGDAIDLVSLASAVVSNDSGLMHIAAALKRNLVAIYGSSSPEFTPPLNENKRIVRLGLECSPCYKRVCPLGHLHCLENLSADMVINAVDELVGSVINVPETNGGIKKY